MPTELSLVIGIFLLIISIILAARKYFSESKTAKALGTVIELRKENPVFQDETVMYYPTIEFCDLNQRKIKFECWGSSSKHGLYKGKSIVVIYDRDNPKKAKIDSWWRRWAILLACTFFGLTFTYLSIRNLINGI